LEKKEKEKEKKKKGKKDLIFNFLVQNFLL
jgi:hypothetical protein